MIISLFQSEPFSIIEENDVRGTFFYVRREVDLMKTAKVNAYIMHIFGKIERNKTPETPISRSVFSIL